MIYDYVVKDCHNNGIYKIIKFKHSDSDGFYKDDVPEKTNDEKLQNNLCRARSTVLELSLCAVKNCPLKNGRHGRIIEQNDI